MLQGIGFALAACFVWGLIFVVPDFMNGFSAIEVALGRYFVYGLVSIILFLKAKVKDSARYQYSKIIWINALKLSLLSTIGYYSFVVLALRYSTPAICTLVLGICPITIAFYGNWQQRETDFSSLIMPSIMILAGLILINFPYFNESSSPSTYMMGIGFSLLALILWSWYVVANMEFLKTYPEVRSGDWATLIGVATLFWVCLLALFLLVFAQGQLNISKYSFFNSEFQSFLISSLILGLGCSWIGASLWNRASRLLPISLAGQLSIFETIFGVIFVYVLKEHIPATIECLGIGLLLFATAYGIRLFSKKEALSIH